MLRSGARTCLYGDFSFCPSVPSRRAGGADSRPRCAAVVMTMHRLSAGAGYQYLLKHTATGDCDRTGASPLTAYYTESGNPPGRWLGSGLAGVDNGVGLAVGAMVLSLIHI